MAKLGNIFLNTVFEEKPDRGVNITDHPIEGGRSITDHVQKQPLTMNITGIIAGPGASTRLGQLNDAMRAGKRMKYVYRNVLNNMVIESFSSTHDVDTKDAFKFTMRLKQIDIAQKATVVKIKKPVTGAGQKQPVGKGAKKVYKVVKGDNLTAIGRKYGVTWQAIYNKNKAVVGKDPNLIYPGQLLIIPA